MAQVQDWIVRHLDGPFSFTQLGSIGGVHPRSLARAFRRETGHSVVSYVQLLRVGRACDLLAGSEPDVIACCFAAGFGNLAHFNRVFRRITGYTPSAYRRLLRH